MNQDRYLKILFPMVVIGIPGFGVFWHFVPYLLFYAMPFAFLSVSFAGLWVALAALNEDDYSLLGLIIPLTAVLVFLLAGFPKPHLILKDGSLAIDGVYFYHWFNNVKAWFDYSLWHVIPDTLAFLAPTVPVPKELYDLNDVRWILWTSLGIGAPILFLVLSASRVRAVKKAIEAKYQAIRDQNEAQLDDVKEESADQIKQIQSQMQALQQDRDHYREEHAKLKTLMEFQKKAAGSVKAEPNHKKGVLDSEDL